MLKVDGSTRAHGRVANVCAALKPQKTMCVQWVKLCTSRRDPETQALDTVNKVQPCAPLERTHPVPPVTKAILVPNGASELRPLRMATLSCMYTTWEKSSCRRSRRSLPESGRASLHLAVASND
eukprot:1159566-Pelagomonas_calceolata.AAC.13